ncbi:phage antirepressor N-terminal domain-containing protein [Pseudomonas chlororaphis]|uniref:phage antirepressor N-terminal domain-containing protein n=1 Tax=Pseudomonas chlororaphis TaxID=587753 RepID=UPI001B3040E1|nr:phage antirepressor N-terminal domain-containing protein [Pseudomonas chlororaphis]QTT83061.1 phage antirepressor N-terminal domain-containing protein [Pseudomonas chlororaphis]
MQPQLMPVPFYEDIVVLVDRENEPYVAMKPIVTNIGLNWDIQRHKVVDRFGSVAVEMTATGGDGKQYNMTCLPLRKLPAWLYSISPNKVTLELRDKVIRYQEECDDALWDYWTKGNATRRGNNSINQQIALSRHRVALLEKLLKSRDNTLRGALHEQLTMVSKQLGLSVPALEAIGKGLPPVPEIVNDFWAALELLDRLGERYNHAGSMSGTIALNYPHLKLLFKKHRISFRFTAELRQALSVSPQPKFLEYKVLYSRIEDKSVRCWVFEGPIRPELYVLT